ncbi:secondary thiamine-phosphate synthase [Acidihalobacter aeolianus]|uniref:Secondary thiamine-phosphate synthase n=1 Tax=Acidihalobacter aeolianus TaxID=2792603 RepID=A0A1D8K6R6_9GAMM|nr:secondary thiamine-phosphate synthase enzyme YjbQ [Acidihalobacter aeolianus]AOV16667.1 secondary thiamine-phosphate synthase [Acidihalobacter aeolianus]
MPTQQFELTVETRGRGSYELTDMLKGHVHGCGIGTGLCHVFVRHTSASLMLCENADPDVRRDLEALMARMIPDGDPLFVHQNEGPDDMPAHARSVLTGSDLTIPVRDGVLALGTWQGVFLWEHRTGALARRLIVTVQGD